MFSDIFSETQNRPLSYYPVLPDGIIGPGTGTFAIRKGAKFIRPVLFIVLGILLIRVLYDFVTFT